MKLNRCSWLIFLIFSITSGCFQGTDASRGSDFTRIQLATHIATLLAEEAQSVKLETRTTRQLKLGKDLCPERGLFLAAGITVTGPHLFTSTFLNEFMPREEMNFAWCDGIGTIPVQGSVYFEDFMHGPGKCGDQSALKDLNRLKAVSTKMTLHIQKLCHTLKNRIGELGLYVDIGEELASHPEYPGAEPLRMLFLKSLELHVLPKNHNPLSKRKEKLKIDKSLRAAMVFSTPTAKLLTIKKVVHGAASARKEPNPCTTHPSLKFDLALHFSYFTSKVVQKSKSSGSAAVSITLSARRGTEYETIQEVKLLLKPKDFLNFKPIPLISSRAGDMRVVVKLDTEVVAQKDFIISKTEPKAETPAPLKAEAPLAPTAEPEVEAKAVSCQIVLDETLKGVSNNTVSLSL